LDTRVLKDLNQKLILTLYTKPTDTHSYLHFTSAHPMHQKTSGPYSQLVRIKRICTRNADFLKFSKQTLEYYQLRGYPLKVLKDAMTRAEALDRTILLIPKDPDFVPPENKDNLLLILDFNPSNPDAKKVLEKNWNIINQCNQLQPLHNNSITVAYKRAPNLRDKLVRAKVHSMVPNLNQLAGRTTNTCMHTIRNPCPYCPLLDTTSGKITSTVTKRTYSTPVGGSCGSNNLVYLVTCRKCNQQYTGETGNSINIRFYGHLYDIRNMRDPQIAPPSAVDKSTPIAKHFTENGHTNSDMKIQIIEYIKKPAKLLSTKVHRRNREFFWMHQLKTVHPQGTNNMETPRWLVACN
jgi:hypothetical protein